MGNIKSWIPLDDGSRNKEPKFVTSTGTNPVISGEMAKNGFAIETIAEHFRGLQNIGFFGSILIKWQNGSMVQVQQTTSFKPEDI